MQKISWPEFRMRLSLGQKPPKPPLRGQCLHHTLVHMMDSLRGRPCIHLLHQARQAPSEMRPRHPKSTLQQMLPTLSCCLLYTHFEYTSDRMTARPPHARYHNIYNTGARTPTVSHTSDRDCVDVYRRPYNSPGWDSLSNRIDLTASSPFRSIYRHNVWRFALLLDW